MPRLVLILCALVVAAMIAAISRSTTTAQERRDDANSFEGQFLSIARKSNPGTSVELEKVHVKDLAGRTFLVGVGAETPDNWQKGRTVWVALDDVAEMTSFPSLEEMKKALGPQGNEKKDGSSK